MSSLRSPVGPQPPSVYWRRRALVGAVLLAVVLVVVLLIVRPGAASPDPAGTNGPAPTETTDAAAPDGEIRACDASVIRLEAVTDKGSYGSDEQPMISLRITNTGSAACELEVGTDVQEYRITSGSDRIWSSRDCQVDEQALSRVIAPGEELETTPFPWDRTRSSTSTCEGDRPAVVADGASYHLSVFLGDLESADTRQFILN